MFAVKTNKPVATTLSLMFLKTLLAIFGWDLAEMIGFILDLQN